MKTKILYIFSATTFASIFISRYKKWNQLITVLLIIALINIAKNRTKKLSQEKPYIIFALFLQICGFMHFYGSDVIKLFCTHHNITKSINYQNTAIITGLVLATTAYPASNLLSQIIVPYINTVIKTIQKRKQAFVTLTAIHVIAIYPIIRADINYIDDIGRITTGKPITGDYSRYLTDFLSPVIHGNLYLTDVSPLPQIIAAIILALSGTILIEIIEKEGRQSLAQIISVIPIGLSPWFLTCRSYKYDAPYMAMSIMVSILPLLYQNKKWHEYFAITTICTTMMCMLYQASSGILPALTAIMTLNAFTTYQKTKETLYKTGITAGGYLTGLFVFHAFMHKNIPTSEYAGTTVSIKMLPANLATFLTKAIDDTTFLWQALFIIIAMTFIIKTAKKIKMPLYIALPITTIITTLSYILSYGAYLFLEKPLTTPRAIYAQGIFIAAISCLLFHNISSKDLMSETASMLLSITLFSFAFTYGNALNQQKEYENFYIETLAKDLAEIKTDPDNEKTNLRLNGSIGIAQSVYNTVQKYPIIKRSIHVGLQDTYWGRKPLMTKYDLDMLYKIENNPPETTDTSNMKLIKESAYYTIYQSDKLVFVKLKDMSCKRDQITEEEKGL